jgi:hypothetical protein
MQQPLQPQQMLQPRPLLLLQWLTLPLLQPSEAPLLHHSFCGKQHLTQFRVIVTAAFDTVQSYCKQHLTQFRVIVTVEILATPLRSSYSEQLVVPSHVPRHMAVQAFLVLL